jgi:2',3'-cyclic-nucleotide 2'-phosphodiesterase (5'-nucleotidase family)
LKAPSVVFNKKNRFIPIVQTGAHGRFVGQLVLNLKGNRQYSFLDYKLHKVTQTKDAQIEAQVQQGLHDLQIQFNEDLSMPISYATKTYQSQYEAVPLIGNLIADAMREATQSDIAYDSGNLYGEMLPQGPVTSYDAYELAPHVYDWSKSGWGMKTCNITGRSLRFIFMLGVLSRTPMYISGAEYTVNGWKVENILVAGKPLVDKKRYKFTLSEGLAKGTNSFYGLDEILCTPWVDSPTLIRNAIRAKIEQTPLITDSVLGPPRIHGLSSQQFKCDECPYPDRNPPY